MKTIVARHLVAGLFCLVASALTPVAQAATYTVTSLADAGAGSLRQAIVDANGNPGADTIAFAVTGAVTLTSGELAITDDLTIQGPGAGRLAVDGNAGSRVFSVSGAGTDVTISGLTIRNGVATGSNGGGVNVAAGSSLALVNSAVSGNAATGNGGGISAAGALTLDGSTVSGNTAGPFGGGIAGNVVVLANSTISGNTAATAGGGIVFNTAATLTHVTVSGNAAGAGGGLHALGAATLANTIVANSAGGDCAISGGSVGASDSLIEDGGCGVSAGINGNLNGDPGLGPLSDNGCVFPGSGGCVRTQALLAGSPAIDAANTTACSASPINRADQRGYARVPPCDMGAYEYGAAPPTASRAPVPAVSTWGLLSLSLALALGTALAMRRRRR